MVANSAIWTVLQHMLLEACKKQTNDRRVKIS